MFLTRTSAGTMAAVSTLESGPSGLLRSSVKVTSTRICLPSSSSVRV